MNPQEYGDLLDQISTLQTHVADLLGRVYDLEKGKIKLENRIASLEGFKSAMRLRLLQGREQII